MASKLRPLYDKLYMGVDTWLLAYNANKDAKNRVKTISTIPNFNKEYHEIVLPYWKKYGIKPKKNWVKIYNEKNDHLDPRYIPDDIWFNKIVPHFNHLLFAQALQDKCLHNLYLPNVKRPVTVVKNISGTFYDDDLNIITKDEAIKRIQGSERILVKPSVGSGKGMDINFYNGNELSKKDVLDIFDKYGKNYIFQEKVKQHEDIAKIHADSLNTIRMITFLYKGKVNIITSTLRMGAGKSEIDNYSQGGFICRITSNGRLEEKAVSKSTGWTDTHSSGMKFSEIVVPNYDRLLDVVKKSAEKLPHFNIVGWDYCIDEIGDPVLIEYNVIPGQNQKTFGPTFGDITDEVLNDVFGK